MEKNEFITKTEKINNKYKDLHYKLELERIKEIYSILDGYEVIKQ